MSTGLPELVQHPSPNVGPRRHGLRACMIVLHYTGMESVEAARDKLCDPTAEVSAHYLIAGDGRLWQLVDESQRAWHAGAGSWHGLCDINSRSIGIELENRGTHPFAAPQMRVLETLMPQIMARWSIPPENVIGHSDMAPLRKQDPGARFDWRRLARQGLAIWPDGAGDASGRSFDELSIAFGYPAEIDEEHRLSAFRLRFRPGATGPVCPDDLRMLATLVDGWPPAMQTG